MSKSQNNSHANWHAAFINKKKAEILARKQQQQQQQQQQPQQPADSSTSSSGSRSSTQKTSKVNIKLDNDGGFMERFKATVESDRDKVEVKKEAESPKLAMKFANDGSFLARFKAMQEQQQEQSSTISSSKQRLASSYAASASSASSTSSSSKPMIDRGLSAVSSSTSSPSLTSRSSSTTRGELSTPASIFKEEEQVEEEGAGRYQPTEYDIAKELAQDVAEYGAHVEQEARTKHHADSRYRFLSDPSSPVSMYYQSQLREMKRNRKRTHDEADSTTTASSSSTAAVVSSSSSGTSAAASSSSSSEDPKSVFEQAKALFAAKAAAVRGGSVHVASVAPIVTEEERRRQKAIDEQRMMNELYRKVVEQQALMAKQNAAALREESKKEKKEKYEYDSDEDTEGGTWEHKKRRKEMQKTEEWAGDLTEMGRGKHHLSDFLPPEELEKFMENVKAVQEGREADISDYAKFKIQADNVGFQLLQKAGWEEGTGLGKKGEGIVQPINRGKTSFDQAGVGTEKPMDIKKDDSDFDLYRKRMMLAYKFRPNPMNNPRRPYY